MKPHAGISILGGLLASLCLAGSAYAAAFNSGSTGADGAFAPTADVAVQLPPSGILHYTTVTIPAGVKVTFQRNSANTAAVILTTGDVKIAGTIDISGGASITTKAGLVGDINKGGVGGVGGYDGARGGLQEQNRRGGTGQGPGGGGGGMAAPDWGQYWHCYGYSQGGGGGGFAAGGEASTCVRAYKYDANLRTGFGGGLYGSNSMLPLVGGSGGGGGTGGINAWGYPGTGGGGGGGALLLVASGAVELTGSILARGGNSGAAGNCNQDNRDNGGAGGGGAGGAVRVITPNFTGAGVINVDGGAGGCHDSWSGGGNGGRGRSSVEIVTGGTFNLLVIPTLAITSIGGVAVPANPTGAGDVTLPGESANPAEVGVSASGVPVGTLVKLTLFQPYGVNLTANTAALAGTLQSSTATGTINIPQGASVLMASTTYTLSLAMGQALSMYAQGERVEKVELAATLGGASKVTLITVSGKQFEVPAAVLAMMPS